MPVRFPSRAPSSWAGSITAAALLALLSASPAAGQQVVAGQNVNMVGGPWSFDRGTGRIVGDPFLQRQNEPSLAVSSRNPCHLLGGSNDYRAVDVPGLPDDRETGDAWMGVYLSIDCGQTWRSTLLPGYPQDLSAEGQASPLKGLEAAADPTVRPGPGGMLYISGLAFNRGANGIGKVFVSRFVDHNNKEQGEPIRFAGTTAVDTGTSGQFLDKPWIATDIPRAGQTCQVDGATMPGGPVYLVYTSFVGGENNPHSKIMFARSQDCGATWTNPSKLSERYALNQGTVMAVNPVDGSIHVAWREFAAPGDAGSVHRILYSRSSDGGKSFSKAVAIESNLRPFDQGSSASGLSFRTNAYPTMAIDGGGRIYVAWAARGFAPDADPLRGDARIVMTTSLTGTDWTLPRSAVDNYPGRGHQIMPALAFAAGRLALAYYDFRLSLRGFGSFVAGAGHTVDVRAAMAEPGATPSFTDYTTVNDGGPQLRPASPVSRYLTGFYDRDGQRQTGPDGALAQLQFNPPNLPMFAQGTTPFMGDYIDIAAQQFILDASQRWVFNTQRSATGLPMPMFHATWADNRDVRRPPTGQTWATYQAPTIVAGPGGNVLVCDPGTNPGSRNQNIYTAHLTPGLVVAAPANQKTVNRTLGLQRAFVLFVKNATAQRRAYRLTLSPAPAGSYASFTPIDEGQLESGAVDVTAELGPIEIPARSSVSRTVFMVAPAGSQYPAVTANVSEVAGAEYAAVVINPDIANPDIANPDIANPDIANPDIANAEVYNPDIANPDIANPDIANPDIANPDIANPDIANPDIANPDIANLTVANPDIANPDIANPDIANPDIANPDIANPDIANPDIANTSVNDYRITDVTWPVRNTGNTTSAYAFKAALSAGLPAGTLWQLIVHKTYTAPSADPALGCAPAAQNQVAVSIPQPNLAADLFASFNPNEYDNNASFFLLPGESSRVTLRVFCPASADGCPTTESARSLAAARVEAQAPNNCPAGVAEHFPNCRVNAIRPDDIYDVSPPTTTCAVTSGGTTYACGDGPFVFGRPAQFVLTAADQVGVQTTTCTVNGQPCAELSNAFTAEGVYTVSYWSEDYSGNVENARTFTVRIDASAPVVAGLSFPGVADAAAWIPASSVTGVVDAQDASALTVTCTDTANGIAVNGLAVTISGDGIHGVSCAVADEAGNVSTLDATIRLDGGAPSLTVPTVVVTAEVASAAGTPVGYDVSADDRWSGATFACEPPSGSVFPAGETTVTCTATDGAGNTATATFTVRVRDTTSPLLNLPAPAMVEATSPAGAAVTYSVTSSDAGDLNVATVCAPASGTVFALGATTVACTATDDAGNTTEGSFTVTVVDTTPPVIDPLPDLVVEATSAGGAQVGYAVRATDAADAAVQVSCGPEAGSLFPIGVTPVSCSAVDDAGNRAGAGFTVTVRDTTPPVVTVAVTPATIWSPNGAMVPVTVSGLLSDAGTGLVGATWKVTDEYGTVQPSGTVTPGSNGTYAFTVSLQASRKGADKNGRAYTVAVTATDRTGLKTATSTQIVAVEHSQGK